MSDSGRIERLAGIRVLVTGASGFIGSHLVERLVADGAEVAALSRGRGRLVEIENHCRFTFLSCDLTDARGTRDAIGKFAPEILFHFASQPDSTESFEHSNKTIDTNIAGTLNTLEALRECGGRAVLYGDSCKVYGSNAPVPYRESTPTEPNSSYTLSKLAGWQICQVYSRQYGIDAVAVRPTLIYGPGQGNNIVSFVIKSLLKQDCEILLDGGTQTRDPLFVSDAVDAFVAAAERASLLRGRVINVGGGCEITVESLARLIVQLSGASADVVSRPGRARPTEMWRSVCDNSEAEAMLGWRPRTPLARGLQETIEYLRIEHARTTVGNR